ncbi:PREDICTED: segmentation protein paired-like isoform X2 [Rhagoletis zephyria]|uniref:segmentation protein paired-like isoform X2 n=1 Tax=Rhagoletis zephyria TaxID=28612 RepID=UPI00081190AC|nr:PREDICTED: segmentation protein paired-like isoform X2 [Rhagoletis zephyria]
MAQFVVIWSIFLCVSCLSLSNGHGYEVVAQQATNVPVVNNNNVLASVGASEVGGIDEHVVAPVVDSVKHDARIYHPAAVTKPRIIEQYDQRSLDGHYEYRYVLSNGDARYERAYWIPNGKNMVLARKGYYSYPMTNDKYLTVFYTADQNGFRQDSATYSRSQPTLPRNIVVPEYVPSSYVHVAPAPVTQRPSNAHIYISSTTRRPHQHPTGNPFIQLYPSSAAQGPAHHLNVGKPSQGHHSHVQHPSVHHPSGVDSPVGGQHPSGSHSSSLNHHASGVHTSSGMHSTSGVHHTTVGHPSGVYPSVPSQSWHSSGVYNYANVPSSGAHTSSSMHGVPSSSGAVHSPSDIQSSSGVHSQAGIHSSSAVHSPSVVNPHQQSGVSSPSSNVDSSSGMHSQAGIHSSSAVHSPSEAHSSSVHHSSVHPSAQPHPAHQHQSSAHASSAHSSPAAAHAPANTPSVPVQSWHYNF